MLEITRKQGKASLVRTAALSALVILLFASLPQILSETNSLFPASASLSGASGSNQYLDRAIALQGSQDRVTLDLLNSLTGGQQSVAAYESAISQFFLPLNIRQVFLDFGWQNYTLGNIPDQQWVSNWLSACDQLGMRNLFYLDQFTTSGIGSPWIMNLIQSNPSTQTYYSNGQPAEYISFDNPAVAKAVETDLAMLYSYYGNHTSWVGIGTGSAQDNPYYAANGALPSLGYSNSSVAQFVNSVYFERDVNQTGFLPSGGLDPLWASFREIGNANPLSSGNYANPSSFEVYGNETAAHMLAMRFYIPQSQQSIALQWYGKAFGSPSDLKTVILPDNGGSFSASQAPLATQNQSSSTISSTASWQAPIQYSAAFSAGYYWVVFEASSSNNQNYYDIYTENQEGTNSNALSSSPSGFSLNGQWLSTGSSVLWIKDVSGSNLTIYPYQFTTSSSQLSQSFVASSSFSFNTVFLYLGIRQNSAVNATLSVIDETSGGQVVAQGTLSQAQIHGLENWVPVSLGNGVTTLTGHTYLIQITQGTGDNSWRNVVQALDSNPSSGGFQNQSQYWLFRLGSMNFAQVHFDYTSFNTGINAVNTNQLLAFRFYPSTSETLQSVKLLMKSQTSSGSFYSSGTLTVALWSSKPSGSSPATPILQSVTLPGSLIPLNGLLTVPGFSWQVTGGQPYWIVLSSSDPAGYTLAQFANPYFSPVQFSINNGATWENPTQGPTDLSYQVVLSSETIGTPVDSVAAVALSSPSMAFAEPFTVPTQTQLSGLFLGPLGLHQAQSPADQLVASLQSDNGVGEPSGVVLASGSISAGNITASSQNYIGFSSVVKLVQGQKYWIVIQPNGGSYFVEPDFYSSPPIGIPSGYTALLSTSGGSSWNQFSGNQTEVLSYGLVSPYLSLPTFNTSSIFSLLSAAHAFSSQTGLLRGWNAYTQASEANTFHSILTSFESLTGQSWIFSAGVDPNVVNQLGYSNNMIGVGSPIEDCPSLNQYLLGEAPLENTQYLGVTNLKLLSNCQSPNASSLARELNYLVYANHDTGPSSNSKILVVGDNQSSNNVSYYLSNAFNVTKTILGSNPNLFLPGALSTYAAVVWLSSSNSTAYSTAIKNYVNGGGRLIVGAPSSSSPIPNWLFPLIGFNPSSIPNSNIAVPGNIQRLYEALTNHTAFNQAMTLRVLTNATWISSGGGLTLAENNLSSGNVVFVQFANGNLMVSPQISNQLVVLSNIIANSLNSHETSPFWYGGSSQSTANSQVIYGITGGSGSPLLVWLSNPSDSNATVSLLLNPSYYGLSSEWSLIDISNLRVSNGSGPFVSINSTVPPESWKPVYIVPASSESVELFSNVKLVKQLLYPNQELYYFGGVLNQSALAALKSLLPVQSVSLNDKTNLAPAPSTAALMTQSEGWYYDANSNTLFVKYVSTGNDSVRVFFSANQSSSTPLGVFSFLFDFGIVLLIVAGVSVFLYLRSRNRRNPIQQRHPLS